MSAAVVVAVAAAILLVAQPAAAGTELVPNGSFEGSLSGWVTYDDTATLVHDGAVGNDAARLAYTSGAWASYYTQAWEVASTTAGAGYTASAWFRSDTPAYTACLRIREWTPAGSVVAYTQKCLTTTTGWQQLTGLAYTVQQTGNQLETYVYLPNPATGETVEVDGVSTTADAAPPTATITSGPTSGTTSTSASFAFTSSTAGATFTCSLDLSSPASCTSPKSYTGLAAGSHTFTVRATDPSSGLSDPSPPSWTWTIQAPAPSSGELVPNGSFEGSLSGWVTYDDTATLVHDGAVGNDAARLAYTSGAWASYYTQAWEVASTTAGAGYTASAWFRSDTPGYTACLRIREWTPAGSVVAYTQKCLTTTTGWQQLTGLAYTVQQTGNQLETYVYLPNPATGETVEVDGVSTTADAAPQTADPVLLAAGDIAYCPDSPSASGAAQTAQLLGQVPGAHVAVLGDGQYMNGTLAEYQACYDQTWGRYKAVTRPSPGAHDYWSGNANGYFAYWGAAAGDPSTGYYSYDLGSWHIVALNAPACEFTCSSTDPQVQWLRNDLAAHPNTCTLAYLAYPLFTSGTDNGPDTQMKPLWQQLYAAGADVVLAGDEHSYERFAPQTPDGTADPTRGIREFVVGTGGRSLYPFGTPAANSEVRYNGSYGVLQLTLHPGGYDWKFLPVAGATFSDSGSGACH